MSYMPAFTNDVETTDLEDRELAAFAYMIQEECHLREQHSTAIMLSRVTRSCGPHATDLVLRQASRMWRVER
jgi:hypothetical protein